jgi:hypothetical protein
MVRPTHPLSPSLFPAHPTILGFHATPLLVAAQLLCTMLHTAHPHAPQWCASHPAHVSAHLWLSTLHYTHCLALRIRALCWRSSTPEPLGSRASLHPAAATSTLPPHMLGSPVPAHFLPTWPRAVMAWAHAPGYFQPPAAHDRARADQRAITISACTPSHPPARVARSPWLRARSPSHTPVRLLGRRHSTPTRARDARPLNSTMPACNQSLPLPFPFPIHVMVTGLYSLFARLAAVTIIINGRCPLVTCRFPLFCTAS